MTSYTKQLQTYLDDKGLDANVEWLPVTGYYKSIRNNQASNHMHITQRHRMISHWLPGMIAVYKLLDRIDTDRNTCNIKRIDDDTVSIGGNCVNMRQMRLHLESGVHLDIEVDDPYGSNERNTLSKLRHCSP